MFLYLLFMITGSEDPLMEYLHDEGFNPLVCTQTMLEDGAHIVLCNVSIEKMDGFDPVLVKLITNATLINFYENQY